MVFCLDLGISRYEICYMHVTKLSAEFMRELRNIHEQSVATTAVFMSRHSNVLRQHASQNSQKLCVANGVGHFWMTSDCSHACSCLSGEQRV